MNEKDQDAYAPWITEPDPPENVMTTAAIKRAAKKTAAMAPELIDKSQDGPIKKSVPNKP